MGEGRGVDGEPIESPEKPISHFEAFPLGYLWIWEGLIGHGGVVDGRAERLMAILWSLEDPVAEEPGEGKSFHLPSPISHASAPGRLPRCEELFKMATGGISTFNINHGFVEALVRGFRSGFLTDSDYSRIQQSESLEDIKMNLKADTDYMGFLDNDTELSPALIQQRAVEKLVEEFDFLEGQVCAERLDSV